MLNIHVVMKVSLILLLTGLLAVSSCSTDEKDLKPAFDEFKFDTAIITRIPLYDSLTTVILKRYDFFQKYYSGKDSGRSFSYRPMSFDGGTDKLPADLIADLKRCNAKLGDNFFDGFDIFKDSTIKIYVRRGQSESGVEIVENLSYYPEGVKIRQRDFPVKDTILNKHWQYWVLFFKPGFPF